jgi:hypothetical protein
MLPVLPQQKLIGHSGNVVAYHDVPRFRPREPLMGGWHGARRSQVVLKKFLKALHGAIAILGEDRPVVNIRKEKALEFRIARREFFAEASQPLRRTANIVHSRHVASADAPIGLFDQIGCKQIENVLERFVEFQFSTRAGVGRIHVRVRFSKDRYFVAQCVQIEEFRFPRIIEIGGVVRDFIDRIDQLSLERWAQIEKILGQLRKFLCGVFARVLDDAFADLKRKIEPRKIQIALLELLDDAQRVQIVVEAIAVFAHAFVEFLFAGVAEGRMPDVVDERQRLDKLRVQAERRGHRAADLRNLESVRQAVAEMIRETCGENLGLGFEPAERARMNDAVAVPRVFTAIGVCRLRMAPATRMLRVHRPGRQCRNLFDGLLREVSLARGQKDLVAYDFGASMSSPRSASSEMAGAGNSFLICW